MQTPEWLCGLCSDTMGDRHLPGGANSPPPPASSFAVLDHVCLRASPYRTYPTRSKRFFFFSAVCSPFSSVRQPAGDR